jgi:hypothetical protein
MQINHLTIGLHPQTQDSALVKLSGAPFFSNGHMGPGIQFQTIMISMIYPFISPLQRIRFSWMVS